MRSSASTRGKRGHVRGETERGSSRANGRKSAENANVVAARGRVSK